MAVLDSVVRPYQSPNVTPEARYIASGQKSNDPILVQIGRGGQGKSFTGSASVKVSSYVDAAENETHGG